MTHVLRRHPVHQFLAANAHVGNRRITVEEAPNSVRGERRWPVTVTVLVAMALPFLLPQKLSLGPAWLIPLLLGLLLIALAIGDPGRIDLRSMALRALRIGLVALLIAQSGWSTSQLVIDLVTGGPETNNATLLFTTGALIWVGNNIAFALLYWELDGGSRRLFEELPSRVELEIVRVIDTAEATHIRYRVRR
jgi:hypothetical protein